MQRNYIVKDDKGNYGQTIPLTKGESRLISVYLFNPDGTPFDYSATIVEILVKVFSNINQTSIQKRLTTLGVAAITKAGASASNFIGFQFALSATDTGNMAANNSGLPMTVTVTDSSGNVLELDFISIFNVTPPVVLT